MLQVIDIRRLEAHQFTPLLEAESRAWNANLRWDYTESARLISTWLQEKRLAGYALVNGGRIQGYSFFFYEGEKGLIGNLFIESPAAGSNPTLLLEHVIETLLGTPELCRVETQLPHFSFHQLEPYFHARCFKGYLRRFMAVSLANRPPRIQTPGAGRSHSAEAEPLFLGDFRIEPWERKHDPQAAQLIFDTYRNHIDATINDQYSSAEGAARLIQNIVLQRGCGEYLPQVSLVAIHRPSQKLAGILALTAVRPRTAHIPQIAVAKEFQSAGLGTALMELSFQELARQGYQEVSLTVTDLNAGAVRRYERLGFETFRTFGAFVWNRP